MQYGLVRFEEGKSKRTTFDVVKTTCIVCGDEDEDGPNEGSQVEVRWRDKGLFQATLIAISDDRSSLVRKMDKAIAEHNKLATTDTKKSKEKLKKTQDEQLLDEIQDADDSDLHTENESLRKDNKSLRKENERLRQELKKYQRLDGLLKSAEAILKGLPCTSCAKAVAGKERAEPEAQSRDEPTSARRAGPGSSAAKVAEQSSVLALPQPVNNQDVNEDDRLSNEDGSQLPVSNGGPGPGNEPIPVQQQPAVQPVQPSEQPGPCSSSSGPSCEPASLATGSATQLQYTWSDPNVVELQTGSSVFVDSNSLRSIETGAKTPTAMARGLLTAVFTRQALLTCSIRGQKAKGLHKPAVQRPPLHAAAIDAILGFTKAASANKGWQFNDKLVVPSMGTKLAEMRADVKKATADNPPQVLPAC